MLTVIASKRLANACVTYFIIVVSDSRDFILTGVGPCVYILNAASMISLILRKN